MDVDPRSARPLVAGRRPHVLIVEDDQDLRYFLAVILENDGYEVGTASNGSEALRWFDSVDAPAGEMTVVLGPGWPGILLHEAIGLVIADVSMPEVGGITLVRRLRADEHHVPVIFITGFGNPWLTLEAERLGALATFDKPFDTDDLRTAVRHALSAPR